MPGNKLRRLDSLPSSSSASTSSYVSAVVVVSVAAVAIVVVVLDVDAVAVDSSACKQSGGSVRVDVRAGSTHALQEKQSHTDAETIDAKSQDNARQVYQPRVSPNKENRPRGSIYTRTDREHANPFNTILLKSLIASSVPFILWR